MSQSIRLAAGSGPTFGVDDLACAAATHLGCWEDEGLSVSWTPALGGIAAMKKILAGEVDAAYGGLGPVLHLRAGGEPLRIVASMARALAQNLVVQPKFDKVHHLRGASWAVDGMGALSHHMARCILAALGIEEAEIDWRVAGPPPERIAQLLSGEVDVSLIRVEEALSLTMDDSNDLKMLLGFAELKKLVAVQPHGVLATTAGYIDAEPEAVQKLARGIIIASRRLYDHFDDFLKTYEHYVSVKLPAAEIEAIWAQERASDGFAVNGELTPAHWDRQIASFKSLNPESPALARGDVIDSRFVANALKDLGTRPGPDEGPAA